jgi:hypothetical protein
LTQFIELYQHLEKRSIIETVLHSIIVSSDEVEINLKDLPTSKNAEKPPFIKPPSAETIVKAVQNPYGLNFDTRML